MRTFETVSRSLHGSFLAKRALLRESGARWEFEGADIELVRDAAVKELSWYVDAYDVNRDYCQMRHDPAHDIVHVTRVLTWAMRIWMRETVCADLEAIIAATLFHDVKVRRKSDPESRHDASESAAIAYAYFMRRGFSAERAGWISEMISRTSFSQKTPPTTPEERIVRDADMLEALGASGITRFFTTGGIENRMIMDLSPPSTNVQTATTTIQALFTRGLAVCEHLHTEGARQLVEEAGIARYLESFIKQMMLESDLATRLFRPR